MKTKTKHKAKVIREQQSSEFDGKFLPHCSGQPKCGQVFVPFGKEVSHHIQLNFSRHDRDIKNIYRIYVRKGW